MEMRSIGDIDNIGQDLTPPIYPVTFSLYNTHLLSHCSVCFSPLSLNQQHSPSSSLSPPLYCSSLCSSHDSPLRDPIRTLISSTHSDSSDLRAALRLLHRIIKEGAKAIAKMRGSRSASDHDCVMEEAALCVVITNAVEVQDGNGVAVGIAVYDPAFSWINHSCSPNACYRFSEFDDDSRMLIAPAASFGGECSGGNVFATRWERYGPKIGVRNIKAISKGEEITIAYTDLLQTKETRQSDLWSKYRFICHCRRCNTLPPAFVDHALQVRLNGALNIDRVVGKLTEYMDSAINEYVKFDGAESCCEKLEHVLAYGYNDGQSLDEGELQEKIRLQPLHHLSLNAYTVLASACKALGSRLLDLSSNSLDDQLNAFDKSRISAAYSLLLAGATHYLYLSESSLIISVANYWTAAGRSLLSLATSTVHNISMERCYPIPNISPLKLRCNNCALKDKFEASSVRRHVQNLDFEQISRDFFNCITDIVPHVWMYLIQGSHYLKNIKSPIDFAWLGNTKDSKASDIGVNMGSDQVMRSLSRCEQEKWYDNRNLNFFQLGAHCLLYGDLVLKICCG
ncbi:hypothetical protein DCAR_0311392 [Daucus carota subsp. sativus]|uniref:SET domain-containing protein n=1 Tax=Daucus carota subsp. sativus TaxID=79200 RepID=A0AAF0WPK7_DAUCS|nr:hypothetical protein DCAR_0311392 [Daucus carota subsp. sativus]